MNAAIITFEIWTVGTGAVFACCALRLHPMMIAIASPAIVALVIAAQAIA